MVFPFYLWRTDSTGANPRCANNVRQFASSWHFPFSVDLVLLSTFGISARLQDESSREHRDDEAIKG